MLIVVKAFDGVGHFLCFLKLDKAFGFDKKHNNDSGQVHETVKICWLLN